MHVNVVINEEKWRNPDDEVHKALSGVERGKTKGMMHVGELILPWSASVYSDKEPSGLPGVWDNSPLGDEEVYGGREERAS